MRSPALSRLAAVAAAALLAAGCAAAPRAAATALPAATAAAPASAPSAYPAAADAPSAYPATAATAYPQPAAGAAATPPAPPAEQPPTETARVINSYPHDPQAYTQGLVYIGDDTFYEGTGLVGRSTLREVALDGTIRRSVPIDPAHFGEGVAVVGERIFQLTWQNGVGYIYDRAGFTQVTTFTMPLDPRDGLFLEGWGLAYDGSRLILSDGSERLFFVDPEATERTRQLAITGEVRVTAGGAPLINLNELEYIDGEVFANIWYDERIARIDPATGEVRGFIDLSGLRAQLPPPGPGEPGAEVLNGIAYDAAGDRLFVTGKLWPRLFEIDLADQVSWHVYLPLERG